MLSGTRYFRKAEALYLDKFHDLVEADLFSDVYTYDDLHYRFLKISKKNEIDHQRYTNISEILLGHFN